MGGSKITFEQWIHAVRESAAFRRVRRLQPVGGPGDKIFPPTYPGEKKTDPPRHVFERRRIKGENVLCVLIDSVQSQANRLEEALRAARDTGRLAFPAISVDFSKTEVADIGRITTLDAPHRVFDAIIRDSELSGKRFRDTDEGRRLLLARTTDVSALFDLSPTALIFGAWNSTGDGGGLGAKFPRAVVSEIIGVGVAEDNGRPSGQRTGSRIDPLGIRSAVRVYKTPDGNWSLDKPAKASKDVKELKPSEINHSNIAPTVESLGVSVDYAQHSFVLSFAALRRLHVGSRDSWGGESDQAMWATLAALGAAAAAAQDRAGYFLRSRCDLVSDASAPAEFEFVHTNGTTEPIALEFESACELVANAITHATSAGLSWRDKDLVLKPQAKLVELVKQSRERALQGEAEEESTS